MPVSDLTGSSLPLEVSELWDSQRPRDHLVHPATRDTPP